nr:immunoglobulin light chain junction region [Macaca mulatta]MOV92163.1 immunoglobulin light chain junction region [Macaca mulatta]MOV92169.1 immunoglobulin light chain junction region [Macaca mulatta]MOV92181.1 immunoglobulin light chain junction region [Macaca mulatta]MOV92182.1 immunoglobulin light chain junction region [Macaca mulatta]
CLQDTQLPPTF